MEELVPQRVPGAIPQQNVQPDLVPHPSWDEIAHFLPASVIALKSDHLSTSVHATVLQILHDGSSQLPSIRAVCARIITALKKLAPSLDSADKTVARQLRQHLLSALLAGQQPALPIQWVAAVIDHCLPQLSAPVRTLATGLVLGHAEEAGRAMRKELERQQASVAGRYTDDLARREDLDKALSAMGVDAEVDVDGQHLRSLVMNLLVQMQRALHAMRLGARDQQRHSTLARREQRIMAYQSSAALSPLVGEADVGVDPSVEPLDEEDVEWLLQSFWRDIKDLDYGCAAELRAMAEQQGRSRAVDSNTSATVTEEDEDEDKDEENSVDLPAPDNDDDDVDISMVTFAAIRDRKVAALNRLLDAIAVKRAHAMGVGAMSAQAPEEEEEDPVEAKEADADPEAEIPAVSAFAVAEPEVVDEEEDKDTPTAFALETGLPATLRSAVESEYLTQLTHLLMMQEEAAREAETQRVDQLKLAKQMLKQARGLLADWFGRETVREVVSQPPTEAVTRVMSVLQAQARAQVESEDEDRDAYVEYVQSRIEQRAADLRFLGDRIDECPDLRPHVRLLLRDLVDELAIQAEGAAMDRLDELRDEYERAHACWVNAGPQRQYKLWPTRQGDVSPSDDSIVDIFGVGMPASHLPGPAHWLEAHVAIPGLLDEEHVCAAAEDACWAELSVPARVMPSGLWDSCSAARSLHAKFLFLCSPVSPAALRLVRQALRTDADLTAHYRMQLDLLRQAFGAPSGEFRSWLEGSAVAGVGGQHCLYPPLPTLAMRLSEAAEVHPAAPGTALSERLLGALGAGEATLAPGPNAGFLEMLAWACGARPLLLDDMPEAGKLMRGPALEKTQHRSLEQCFTGAISSHRVDMVPDLELPRMQRHDDHLSPQFELEPLPTYYCRLFLAFRTLRLALVRACGSALRHTPRAAVMPGDAFAGNFLAERLSHDVARASARTRSSIDVSLLWRGTLLSSKSLMASSSSNDCVRGACMMDSVALGAGTGVASDVYEWERTLLGCYLVSCENLGIHPEDLATLVGGGQNNGGFDDDEDDEEEVEITSKYKSMLTASEAENGYDDGLDLSVESWDDGADCMVQLREWTRNVKRDTDVALDWRSMRIVGDVAAGPQLTAVTMLGWTRKLVAVGFHSLPRVIDVDDSVGAVVPETRENGDFLSCPRCGWELCVPALDASGVFKCSGESCATVAEALLVRLTDGAVAPVELRLEHVWVWAPVISVVQATRKWRSSEVRAICDAKHTEAAISTSVRTSGRVREPVGGLQAQVAAEVLDELSAWFRDIDKRGGGKLSRARVKAYFAASGGETGFFSGDTMFYCMDRNQDGWVEISEFRVAILHIYRENIKLLRVEKISALREKFNELYHTRVRQLRGGV